MFRQHLAKMQQPKPSLSLRQLCWKNSHFRLCNIWSTPNPPTKSILDRVMKK